MNATTRSPVEAAHRLGIPASDLLNEGFDERDGWALVEFWTNKPERYQPFVDFLNTELRNANL